MIDLPGQLEERGALRASDVLEAACTGGIDAACELIADASERAPDLIAEYVAAYWRRTGLTERGLEAAAGIPPRTLTSLIDFELVPERAHLLALLRYLADPRRVVRGAAA